MKYLYHVLCLAALSAAITAEGQKPRVPQVVPTEDVAVETGAFSPSWDGTSAWECPDWFRDAKFGIWSHWGPQCQAEDGDWYGRHMYYEGHSQYQWHCEHFGDPSVYGLKELIRDWKAEEWDPDRLVAFYKSVGARYFFTLGQHHDNFDLWDSPYQPWNSTNMGPMRNIVGEYAAACRRYGLPLGISFHGSHTWTWMEKSQDYDGNLTKADGAGQWWEGYDPQDLYAQRHTPSAGWQNPSAPSGWWEWGGGASLPDEAFKRRFQNRVLQCINEFSPSIIYFDDTVLPFHHFDDEAGLRLLAHYYNRSARLNGGVPSVVATGKILNAEQQRSMLWDVERGIPDECQSEPWQTCTCLGSWHYDRPLYERNGYKSAATVVRMLVDIVSKNGNLLLSVPLRGSGVFDEKEEAILNDIKAWMDVNGRSVYGTRPWKTVGEGPQVEAAQTGGGSGGFNEGSAYTARDVRYVCKSDTVFATVLGWPAVQTFTFKSLALTSPHYSGTVQSVRLLGVGDVPFEMTADGLTVTLPATHEDHIAPVFQITFVTDGASAASVSDIVAHYETRIADLLPQAGYNTGSWCRDSIEVFAAEVERVKQLSLTTAADEREAIVSLNESYARLQHDGRVTGREPNTEGSEDMTAEALVEVRDFQALTMGERFGTPENWTVENYTIPQINTGTGVKNGIDNYPGYRCLMLGVWQGEDGTSDADLANARITRTVHLAPGRYFFGASFQHIYQLNEAYVFASSEKCATGAIPERAIAWQEIAKCTTDGTFTGVQFTLKHEQDVVLGFQADMASGSATQEFRVSAVELLYFGEVTSEAFDNLFLDVDAAVTDCVPSENTGFFSQQALDALRAVRDEAERIESSELAQPDLEAAYHHLLDAYQTFLANGRNPGGAPDETSPFTDITQDALVEAHDFSREGGDNATRFGTPKHWTVENFRIPQRDGSGTKNGIDHNPGYDCLSMGVWEDKAQNTDGTLANARLYRNVHLEAGRYYFGAKYENRNEPTDQSYIFASTAVLPTTEIETSSTAWYPLTDVMEMWRGGGFYGIYFTQPADGDVLLGFQTDLENGSEHQEFRVSEVTLRRYDTATGMTAPQCPNTANNGTPAIYSLSGARLPALPNRGTFIVRSGSQTKKYLKK